MESAFDEHRRALWMPLMLAGALYVSFREDVEDGNMVLWKRTRVNPGPGFGVQLSIPLVLR